MTNYFDFEITIKDLKDNLDEKWSRFLGNNLFERPYWKTIKTGINKTIKNKKIVIPNITQIFSPLNSIELDKFRVLIIGQDPYPTIGYANGFSFSTTKGLKIPKSLENIYKEIDLEYGTNMVDKNKFNGDLIEWSKQGVLLLNSSLTIGEKNESHISIGWNFFTEEIIKFLDLNYTFVTLAMGAKATNVADKIIINNKNNLIKTGHPSPLNTAKKFIGCNCFSDCNKLLIKQNLLPIKWEF